MTFDECKLKAKELRQKDPTAGSDDKKIMYLPTEYDEDLYACMTRLTLMSGYKSAFEHCNYNGEDLSIFFYNPETKKWTLVDI